MIVVPALPCSWVGSTALRADWAKIAMCFGG
ncbi:hypothetical protein FHR37_005574 [Actinopolymorpha cephalotaxi]|uniref:Uncharacterized protein n=1 Tax=Actinopolymorpha cephalotaxi TaxID=504797 RepID=A0ABX2SAQ4_9ACTN|nr:hypothetical protein [Actinopolymorpha cephalotaxi]